MAKYIPGPMFGKEKFLMIWQMRKVYQNTIKLSALKDNRKGVKFSQLPKYLSNLLSSSCRFAILCYKKSKLFP